MCKEAVAPVPVCEKCGELIVWADGWSTVRANGEPLRWFHFRCEAPDAGLPQEFDYPPTPEERAGA